MKTRRLALQNLSFNQTIAACAFVLFCTSSAWCYSGWVEKNRLHRQLHAEIRSQTGISRVLEQELGLLKGLHTEVLQIEDDLEKQGKLEDEPSKAPSGISLNSEVQQLLHDLRSSCAAEGIAAEDQNFGFSDHVREVSISLSAFDRCVLQEHIRLVRNNLDLLIQCDPIRFLTIKKGVMSDPKSAGDFREGKRESEPGLSVAHPTTSTISVSVSFEGYTDCFRSFLNDRLSCSGLGGIQHISVERSQKSEGDRRVDWVDRLEQKHGSDLKTKSPFASYFRPSGRTEESETRPLIGKTICQFTIVLESKLAIE